MSKKGKDREVSHLRAEIEFLRAQLKSTGLQEKNNKITDSSTSLTAENTDSSKFQKNTQKTAIVYRVEPEQLKNDLVKTLVLTTFSLVFLFVLYYSQPFLPTLSQNLSKILQGSSSKLPAIK